MKKKLLLLIVTLSFLHGSKMDTKENSCITKPELIEILRGIFPDNKNLKRVNRDKPKLYNEMFGSYSSDKIIAKLKYYHKKNDEENVLMRCDYLFSNRELPMATKIELLDVCSEYEIRQYQYDTAIEYLEELLDINRGEIKTRDIVKRLIYLYEKKKNAEKVRYLKNIIND